MDLGAYANIGNLEWLVKANNIEVPRLRGYRLMKYEKPLDIRDYQIEGNCCEDLCCSIPFWCPSPRFSEYCDKTEDLCRFYVKKVNGRKEPRWERIHGWKRRVLKTYIHNEKKKYEQNINTFNKYVGRDDVLYIHSRIGGGNWPSYFDQVVHKPWFIEKVDDPFDSTYCDIYARLTIKDPEEAHGSN